MQAYQKKWWVELAGVAKLQKLAEKFVVMTSKWILFSETRRHEDEIVSNRRLVRYGE